MRSSSPPAAAAAAAAAAALVVTTLLYTRRRRRRQRQQQRSSSPRILVTGFGDWKKLQDPPNIWKICENPSARLLTGCACENGPPVGEKTGPLAQRLRSIGAARRWHFSFQTLPTVWRSSWSLDRPSYDAVVHLGLGVYDSFHSILVEDGAVNQRVAAPDASGAMPPSPLLDEGAPPSAVLEAPPRQRRAVEAAVEGLAEELKLHGGFSVRAIRARPENSYICNETHWRGLEELATAGRLSGVFFVHIPYPETPGEYGPLAGAVAAVVEKLVVGVLRDDDEHAG